MGRTAPAHLAEPLGYRRRGLAVLLAAAALVSLQAVPTAGAVTAPTETVVAGEHLQLVSITSPAMSSLSPGGSAAWDVGVAVTTAGEATVDVTLQVLSAPADTFEVQVARCDERWTAQGCPSAAVSLLDAPLATGVSAALGTADGDEAPWYRVVVTMIGAGTDAAATLRLHAEGVGEELSAGPGPGAAPGDNDVPGADPDGAPPPDGAPLPDTGTAVLGRIAIAVGAVLTGMALAALARRRARGGRR